MDTNENDRARNNVESSKQNIQTFSPQADIFEDGNAVRVILDMPGVGQAGLDVNLDKNLLSVDGKIEARHPQGMKLVHREFGEGNYHRSFSISDEIETEGITASIKNGVVELILPKKEASKPKKIPVALA